MHLSLFSVDGAWAVGSCRRRGHGANDSYQCADCKADSPLSGSVAQFEVISVFYFARSRRLRAE